MVQSFPSSGTKSPDMIL